MSAGVGVVPSGRITDRDALVLRRVEFGEADLVVTLLVRELGKVAAVARGARRSKRRFAGGLSPLMPLEVELSASARRTAGAMYTLTQSRPTATYDRFSHDLAAMAHGSYATELARELIADGHPEDGVLDLLLEFLAVVEGGPSVPVLRAFELSLLHRVGLSPQLSACVSCGESSGDAMGDAVVLSPKAGGVLCRSCAARSRDPRARTMSPAARDFLLRCQNAVDLTAAADIELVAEAAEARDAALALVLFHVGKPLRSVDFINKLSGAAARSRGP